MLTEMAGLGKPQDLICLDSYSSENNQVTFLLFSFLLRTLIELRSEETIPLVPTPSFQFFNQVPQMLESCHNCSASSRRWGITTVDTHRFGRQTT